MREMRAVSCIGVSRRADPPVTDPSSTLPAFTSAAALGTKSGAIQRSKTMMGNLRTGDRKDKQSGGRIKAADVGGLEKSVVFVVGIMFN